MSETSALDVLDEFSAKRGEKGLLRERDFPFSTLQEVASARDLPPGSAARVLAVLDVGIEPPDGKHYDGQDLRRRALVARALGACFSDVAVAAPKLVEWLASAEPHVSPSPGGPVPDDFERNETFREARRSLAEACLESLERLQAPPSPEYEAALEVAAAHSDPDLKRDVEYARERLRSAKLAPVRARLGGSVAEVVARLEGWVGDADASARKALPAAGRVVGWLVDRADAVGAQLSEAGAQTKLDHAALLSSVVDDLVALSPDALGDLEEERARELSATLAATLDGDAEAAAKLDEASGALSSGR